MTTSGRRKGTGSTPGPPGVVTGMVLRSAREQIALTQAQLAECLNVDTDTVKGWETGRRALGNTKVATLRRVTHQLRLRGAQPRLLAQLDLAIDVDLVLGDTLAQDSHSDPLLHPLATWVTTRQWTELLSSALSGPRPLLGAGARAAFFGCLRDVAERSLGCAADPESGVLLRRQAAYILATWDDSASHWIAEMGRREPRTRSLHEGWSPAWAGERSLAVSRAVAGDRDPLRSFIDRRLAASGELETANLAYWAYWIGEGSGQATTDQFMVDGGEKWTGNRLVHHLAESLTPTSPYVELTLHSLWALVVRRPHLLREDPRMVHDLETRTDQLLDIRTTTDLGHRATTELEQIRYAMRMMKGNR